MMQLEDLYDVPLPTCAFYGGPWDHQVRVMPAAPETFAAAVPVQVALFDVPQTDTVTEMVVYRLRGIDDDGTRRYYVEDE